MGDPDRIRSLDIKLPIEGVVDHYGRLAAILARGALAADLRRDPGQLGQVGERFRQRLSLCSTRSSCSFRCP